jgi:DNA-directed RNA polymerase I subunit RPA2
MPAVKCVGYEDYGLSEYPSGVNAVVAVISYTGYDMEDAMIVCKSSYERGLGHGVIYKTMRYSLSDSNKTQRYQLISRLKPLQYKEL